MNYPFSFAFSLAIGLFALGLIGLLVRRNVVFLLLSIEIMLNAAGFAFVLAGELWHRIDGQVMFIFVLTMAAAEVSIGLALIIRMFHRHRALDTDDISQMKG